MRKKSAGPKPPRFWFEVEDSYCCKWKLYLVSRETCPQLGNDDAVALQEQGLIAISDDLTDDRIRMAAFHELCHIPGTHSGSPQTLKNILHCTAAEVTDRDEDMVSWFSPPLFAVLYRNGMLKFPKIPR
jgi:hypothetical protein